MLPLHSLPEHFLLHGVSPETLPCQLLSLVPVLGALLLLSLCLTAGARRGGPGLPAPFLSLVPGRPAPQGLTGHPLHPVCQQVLRPVAPLPSLLASPVALPGPLALPGAHPGTARVTF